MFLEYVTIAKSSSIPIELLITILSGVVGITANYFVLKGQIEKQKLENAIHKDYAADKISKFEERLAGVSASKRAAREAMELSIKELKAERKAEIEKLENMVTKRIDKTQEKQNEFEKEINKELKAINSGIANIEGLLSNLGK